MTSSRFPSFDNLFGSRAAPRARTNSEQIRYLATLVGQPGNFWDPSIRMRLEEMANELDRQEQQGDDWLRIGSAKQQLKAASDEIGRLANWLETTKKRFNDFSDKELRKPDGELSQLRTRHEAHKRTHAAEILSLTEQVESLQKTLSALRMTNEEQSRQIQRLVETVGRRSRAHKSTVLQARAQAVRADALQVTLDETKDDLDKLSKAVVTKLLPHQQARAAAQVDNDTFALQAAIGMEHAAVPNHGRLTGRSDCLEDCDCSTKPKVCRVCRTYTGGLVIAPCRTTQIALGE